MPFISDALIVERAGSGRLPDAGQLFSHNPDELFLIFEMHGMACPRDLGNSRAQELTECGNRFVTVGRRELAHSQEW